MEPRSRDRAAQRCAPVTVLVKGAGDIASGIAHCFWRSGFAVVMTETAHPTVIRRGVSFAEAVFKGSAVVEGVHARLAHGLEEAEVILARTDIPVLVDPRAETSLQLGPAVVIDAIMAKANRGTSLQDAPLVIGIGPGFEAGSDVVAVIETQRGHDLGRVILRGSAKPNTGIPGEIGGHTTERVLRAPTRGTFMPTVLIGSTVMAGDAIGSVDGTPVETSISGVLRGVLGEGLTVSQGQKIGDVDPRGIAEYAFTISDKSRAIAGSALMAVLWLSGGRHRDGAGATRSRR
jgi:xanthine dehydrogenase accessory factor